MNARMRASAFSFAFISSFVFFYSLSAFATDYTTGYQIPASGSDTVYTANGNWYKVSNGSGAKNYFIPSKTAAEGNAFAAHVPTDLTVAQTNAPSCLQIMNYQKVTTNGQQTIDPDGPGGNAPVNTTCDMTTDGGGWTLVLNQNVSGGYFTKGSNELSSNPNDSTQNLYSILFTLESFRKSGAFTFRLKWPGYTPENIWSQTTNPTVDQPVAGYSAISVSDSSEGWGGLEHNSTSPSAVDNAYMDGSVGIYNWFFAVASYNSWGANGIPAGDSISSSSVTQTQLWVK